MQDPFLTDEDLQALLALQRTPGDKVMQGIQGGMAMGTGREMWNAAKPGSDMRPNTMAGRALLRTGGVGFGTAGGMLLGDALFNSEANAAIPTTMLPGGYRSPLDKPEAAADQNSPERGPPRLGFGPSSDIIRGGPALGEPPQQYQAPVPHVLDDPNGYARSLMERGSPLNLVEPQRSEVFASQAPPRPEYGSSMPSNWIADRLMKWRRAQGDTEVSAMKTGQAGAAISQLAGGDNIAQGARRAVVGAKNTDPGEVATGLGLAGSTALYYTPAGPIARARVAYPSAAMGASMGGGIGFGVGDNVYSRREKAQPTMTTDEFMDLVRSRPNAFDRISR